MPVIIDGTLGVNAAAVTTTSWNPTNLVIPGNSTIGDATSDTLTVNAGALNFAQSAQKITGDMSTSTVNNRFAIQSNVTNGQTVLNILPNGTGTISSIRAFNNSDASNGYYAGIQATSTEAMIAAGSQGGTSYIPMTFYTGNAERLRIDTSGRVTLTNTTDYDGSTYSHFGIGRNTTVGDTYLGFGTHQTNHYSWIQSQNAGVGAYPLLLNPQGGNVGVGVITPNSKFNVNGTISIGTFTGDNTFAAPTTSVIMSGSNQANMSTYTSPGNSTTIGVINHYASIADNYTRFLDIAVLASTTGATGAIRFLTGSGSATTPERMRIDGTGKIGIGTTAPQAGLHVGTGTILSGTNPAIGVAAPAFGGVAFGFDGAPNLAQIVSTNPSTSSMAFYTKADSLSAPAERLRITESGFVGIGISSPQARLHVNGPGFFEIGAAPFINAKFKDYSDGSGMYIGSVQAGTGKIISGEAYYYNSGYWRSDLTTSSAMALDSGTVRFYGNTGLTANTNFLPTERARITTSGDMCVGTTTANGSMTNTAAVSAGYFRTYQVTSGALSANTNYAITGVKNGSWLVSINAVGVYHYNGLLAVTLYDTADYGYAVLTSGNYQTTLTFSISPVGYNSATINISLSKAVDALSVTFTRIG